MTIVFDTTLGVLMSCLILIGLEKILDKLDLTVSFCEINFVVSVIETQVRQLFQDDPKS